MAYENHIFVKQQFGMANIEHDDIMVGANSSEKARQRTFAMPNLCNTNHSDCIFNSRDKCDNFLFLIWLSKVVDKLFQTLQLILVTSEWKFKLFSDFGINNQKILMFSDCRVYI